MSAAFFKLTPNITINLDDLSSFEIEGNQPLGFSDAGRRRTRLRVVMRNGVEHTVDHDPPPAYGHDAYKIKAALDAATTPTADVALARAARAMRDDPELARDGAIDERWWLRAAQIAVDALRGEASR